MIERYSDISHIKGWFGWYDFKLFETILAAQADSEPGTLVELGAYLGKSAVVIGDALRKGEEFVVLDLFGADPDPTDLNNRKEIRSSYRTLSQQQFEENYLTLHESLPRIIRGPSSEIMEHVVPGSVRFCHIDASHLYKHVLADAENAERMMRPGGVVVFDDYRSAHTPGVAAVVWDLVMSKRFIPIALTPQKMYGAFSDPDPTHDAVANFARAAKLRWEEQEIAGYTVLRLARKKKSKPATPPLNAPGPALSEERLEKIIQREYSRAAQTLTMTVQAQLSAWQSQNAKDMEGIVSAGLRSQIKSSVQNALNQSLEGQPGKHLAARIARKVTRQIDATSGIARFRRRLSGRTR